jgi:hypothetical protein
VGDTGQSLEYLHYVRISVDRLLVDFILEFVIKEVHVSIDLYEN